LKIADGKRLTIEYNDVNFLGVDTSSVIDVGKDGTVLLSDKLFLSAGSHSWIQPPGYWSFALPSS
jgi:hypothetical protein